MHILRRRLYLALLALLPAGMAAGAVPEAERPIPVAAIIGTWFPYSHAEVILGRLLKTYTMDGKGEQPRLKLVSLYRDTPDKRDMSEALAKEYGFTIYDSITDALTLGTGKLAVEGVLLVTEHGLYPYSPRKQLMRPHLLMFDEILQVYRDSGRVAPIFVDKHLDHTWQVSKWMVETAREMQIPLMAGSSVPGTWRHPAADMKRGAKLKEIVGISYHTLDAYGFHGLEMVQCLAERRKGGETGVESVQTLVGEAVWEAAGKEYDPALLADALARLERPLTIEDVKKKVKEPVLFIIRYRDGLRATLFTLNGAVAQWASAWRYADDTTASTLFWTHETLPGSFMHFAAQVKGIEEMILTGKPAWPAERTLYSSALLDALLLSKYEESRVVETPFLDVRYTSEWNWKQLPDPEPVP